MTFDFDRFDYFFSADSADHWLDEALRAVPLPDGFLTRMSTLAETALPEAADGRDHSSPLVSARPGDGGSYRVRSSIHGSRPHYPLFSPPAAALPAPFPRAGHDGPACAPVEWLKGEARFPQPFDSQRSLRPICR